METRILEILEKIYKAGYQGYLVGGSSRDEILQRPYFDIDIATNAPIETITNLFDVISNQGLHFYNVKIKYKDLIAEITSFRLENYPNSNGYPVILGYAKTIQEDAKRRDFTMNAIYLDKNGNCYDPFGGIDDLKHHLIRFINDPKTRIFEDPTRIFRAIRFKNRFHFDYESKTQRALNLFMKTILNLSNIKLAKEIKKTYDECGVIKTNEILQETKINQILFQKEYSFCSNDEKEITYEEILNQLKQRKLKEKLQ